MRFRIRTKFLHLLPLSLLTGLTTLSPSEAALSADRLTAIISGAEVSVPLDDVERFAITGEISEPFEPLAQELGEPTLTQMRGILLKRLTIDADDVERLTDTPLMEPLFEGLGKAFQSPEDETGYADIQTAIVRAAYSEDGLTLLNVMRQFPSDALEIEVPYIIQLIVELEVLIAYRESTVHAIAQDAEQEATSASSETITELPDLRSSGSYSVEKQSFSFSIRQPRLTPSGLAMSYDLPVDLYLPQDISQPVPLIVMSHGFGATRTNYAYLAEHLASHGFAVAALEHIGSDLQYRQVFLEGELDDIIRPLEYISRSLDITYLLDNLEAVVQEDEELADRLDLEQIGVMGNSFGGTTALSVAGAPFNPDRLRQDCSDDRITVSVSFMIQCIAKDAPFANLDLSDRRIKAVLAAYPMTSSVFGPEGISQITVPTMIVAGSEDFLAPVVQDQIHPFIWLQTPNKYLALMVPGTHFPVVTTPMFKIFHRRC